MQKQKKNLSLFKIINSKTKQILKTLSAFSVKKRKKKKQKKKVRKLLFYISRVRKFLSSGHRNYKTILYLCLKQNNIFATFLKTAENKVWHTYSSGLYSIKITKRRLKAGCAAFLQKIFIFLRKYLKSKKLFISLVAPRHLRRFIVRRFLSYLSGFSFFISFQQKKCFNGCRVKKSRRKKHKKFRILQ